MAAPDIPALGAMRSLRSLDLSSNFIGLGTVLALAPHPELHELNIFNTNIYPDHARALAELPSLRRLDASSNGIADTGAIALAGHLGLVDLNVGFNAIGDRGALALAAMPSLRRLGLADNRVTSVGASALIANRAITWIDLADNAIDEPSGLSVDPSRVDLKGNPTHLPGGEFTRFRSDVIAEIDAAFDGVPPPDADHNTLYQAQANDSYEECDQSRDHFGRWQDLPGSHLQDCPSAMSYLDAQGYRYYLPAIMTAYLRNELQVNDPEFEHLLIYFILVSRLSSSDYDFFRNYTATKMRLLTPQQRLAIAHFVEVPAGSHEVEVVEAWGRVVAFDSWDGTHRRRGLRVVRRLLAPCKLVRGSVRGRGAPSVPRSADRPS